jgi:hypothetical protein
MNRNHFGLPLCVLLAAACSTHPSQTQGDAAVDSSGAGGNGAGGASPAGAGGGGGSSTGRGGSSGSGGTSAGGHGGAAGVGSGSGGAGGTSPPASLPLSVSADKRYIVDSAGKPFLVAGDSPQCLTARLTPANMSAYFAARAAQGFNSAWVNLLCNTYTGGNADGTSFDGIAPFTGMLSDGTHYDLSKPNPTFFARVDAAVSAAAANHIVLFLVPIETGGFLDTIRANGTTGARNYGRYVGQRYASADNILWMSGNDFRAWLSTSDDAVVQQVAMGIKDMDTRHLQTVELDYPTDMSSLDDATWEPLIDMNTTYTYYPTYAQLYVDYNRTNHLPNVMIEANYEGENNAGGLRNTNAHDVRTQYYWSNLSGATGSFYGNHWEVFALDNATWQANLAADQGAPQMAYVQALFMPRAWTSLVPDQNNTVVTSGYPTFNPGGNAQDNTYATTASTADGTLVMSYMPTARTITVDMTKLAGPAVARWYDPTTGTYTAIAGSPLANTGSKSFTPPTQKHTDTYDDWVLVLETTPPP